MDIEKRMRSSRKETTPLSSGSKTIRMLSTIPSGLLQRGKTWNTKFIFFKVMAKTRGGPLMLLFESRRKNCGQNGDVATKSRAGLTIRQTRQGGKVYSEKGPTTVIN